jgi:hypothetical protein
MVRRGLALKLFERNEPRGALDKDPNPTRL